MSLKEPKCRVFRKAIHGDQYWHTSKDCPEWPKVEFIEKKWPTNQEPKFKICPTCYFFVALNSK